MGQVIDTLGNLLDSGPGQAVAAVVSISVVYAFFSFAKAVLGILKKKAAETPNKIDDQLVEAAGRALEDAKKEAVDHVKRKK